MSDTIEDMKAVKEVQKHWATERAEANLAALKALGIDVYEQSKNVFRMDTAQGAVMYYPAKGIWQHRGRTTRGSVQDFRTWLKNKHFLG